MDLQKFATLQTLHNLYSIDQLLFGNDFIREFVRRIAQEMQVKYVMVGHALEPERNKVQSDFMWADGKFVDNVTYDLSGTPCVHVLCGTRVSCHAQGVAQAFPEDRLLMEMGVESYIGAPFLHTDGTLIGLLVIMDDKPIEDQEAVVPLVEFFAARIGTEYRRMNFEESLRKVNENLEKAVEDRTIELREAFENLRRTQRQMISQEKLATIGRITFGIAHELKNPLNVIINSAEILSEEGNDIPSDELKNLIGMIREHSARANDIITSMLKQARHDDDNTVELVSISSMLEHSLEMCLRSISDLEFRSHLTISKNITEDLETKISNPASLERVFINVFDNALYALRKKFKQASDTRFTPQLSVMASCDPADIQICVRDNGIGIPDKQQTRVFDEFYTTKPAGEGTGLGLSIARQTLENNNGEIHLHSEDGLYTEVFISIPQTEPAPEISP